MSGIAGLFYLDGCLVQPYEVEKLINTLVHRGRDGGGIWYQGSVGLGHCMMWTTSESLYEKLPFVNQTGSLVITADARIDNRHELLPLLGFSKPMADVIPDSQLILAAYERWGKACLERLLGDFAFAIWDSHEQSIFCACDQVGIKPFFYYQNDRLFAFASEIKALLALPEVPCRLNEVRIADYLLPMLEDKVITFYKDILRLPPAHSLTIKQDSRQLQTYWSLNQAKELRLPSNEAYAEAFQDLFTEAVNCRLRSVYPVGSMLSGGLDSSSIVTTARLLRSNTGKNGLPTFSAIFPSLPASELAKIDERTYIEAVLAGGGLEPHYVQVDQISPLADLNHRFTYEDEAFVSPQLFMAASLYRAASTQGIRVVLDGFGGDSTVSHGTAYLTELVRSGQWASFATEVKAHAKLYRVPVWRNLKAHGLTYLTELACQGKWLAFYKHANAITHHFDISRTNIFLNYGVKRVIADALSRSKQQRLGRSPFASAQASILNPTFARRIGLSDRVEQYEGKRGTPPATLREDHYLELNSGVIPLALAEASRAGVAAAVEPRFPFLDKRLLEFCLSLPGDQKLNQGWSRIILRRAMTQRLPEVVQWRPGKADLGPNFSQGLAGADRIVIDEVFRKELNSLSAYVNVPMLRDLYSQYTTRQSEAAELVIWRVAVLASWLGRAGLTP
jgi:asparagine synthase (glutamine-hydrolysing)